MNVLGDSLSYDHHGMLNWGTRMLYLNTTSPDWFNRMMLLIAKMKGRWFMGSTYYERWKISL